MRFIAPFVAATSAAQLSGLSPLDIPRCTKADFAAVHTAVTATPAYPACVADLGYTVDQVNFEHILVDAVAVDKLLASPNCVTLYHNAQSLEPKCLELQVLQSITWDMAAAVLKVASYPKVSANCDKKTLLPAFLPLVFDENVMTCLNDAGLNLNDLNDNRRFQTKQQLPTIEQVERVRNSTGCRAVYAKAEGVLATLPHCQFEKSNGTDIHVFEKLTFDVIIDWVEFGIRMDNLTKHGASNYPPVAVNLAAHFGFAPATDATSHSVAVVSMYMAAGAFLAVVALYVAQQRKQGYQPISGVAASHV